MHLKLSLLLVGPSLLIGLVSAIHAPWQPCPLPSSITHIKTDAGGQTTEKYYNGSTVHLSTLHETYKALAHCPNIERLDLRTKVHGCSGWPDALKFDFTPGGRFSALKEIRLEGYDFDSKPADHKRRILEYHFEEWNLRSWWFLDPYWYSSGKARAMAHKYAPHWMGLGPYITPTDMITSFDHWLEAMDWSKVEVLDITDPSLGVLQQLPTELASLKELKFHLSGDYVYSESQNPDCDRLIPGSCDPTVLLVRFINELPKTANLDSLSLTNHWTTEDIAQMLLSGKLPSLTSLHLRYDAASSVYGLSHLPSNIQDEDHHIQLEPWDIALINSLAPNLASLSMIASHNATDRAGIIEWLGQMKSLQHLSLQIQLPAGQRAFSPFRDTFQYRMERGEVDQFGGMEDQRITEEVARTMRSHLNETMALDLFRELREHKEGRESRSLEMETLSEWVGLGPDGPLHDVSAEEWREVVTCDAFGPGGERKMNEEDWCVLGDREWYE